LINLDDVVEKTFAWALGAGGLTAIIAGLKARREARNAVAATQTSASVDLRKIVDQTSSDVLANILNLWKTCEAKHEAMGQRLDSIEAKVVVLTIRDQILRSTLTMAGVAMPAMPEVPHD